MHVAIVGAGVIGVATAYYLRLAGVGVTVLERCRGAGLECSYRNAGGLHPGAAEPWNGPGVLRVVLDSIGRPDAPLLLRPSALPSLLGWGWRFLRAADEGTYVRNAAHNTRLARLSVQLMSALREETGLDEVASARGLLKVFRDPSSLERYARLAAEMAVRTGLEHQRMDAAATIDREPALEPIRERIVGALYFPADEIGDSHLFCTRLATRLTERGVGFRFGTAVRRLHAVDGAVEIELVGGERLAADSVVVAAGAHSPRLVAPLGLSLPVRPVKGYSLTLPTAGWRRPRHMIADMGLHAGATPVGGDRLRVAGTAEFAGFDRSLPAERVANLLRLVEGLFPRLAARLDGADLEPWAGLRPMSPDGVPILGATAVPGLYLNTGHGHLGWTTAAASGRLVADAILVHPPELDPRPFSIDRFRAGASRAAERA